MSGKIICMLAAIAAVGGWVCDASAQSDQKAAATSAPVAITAAVLDFEGQLAGNATLGQQISEILSVRLSMIDGLTIVERANLGKILEEQKLKLAGLVSAEQSAKVGNLVGAKLLVMGKATMMGDKLTIIAKVVGVETGVMKGVIITVGKDKEVSDAIGELTEKVSALIIRESASLLPKGQEVSDPIPELKKSAIKKFGDKMPTLAVTIPEQHVSRIVIDPAVETEVRKVLIEAGFNVAAAGKADLAEWVKKNIKATNVTWPDGVDKVDYIVLGEGISEFAGRTGDLVTCTGRAEIALAQRSDGKVLLSDRCTARGVDLAETIAGKTALQSCGYKLGLAVVRKLVEEAK